MERARIGVIGAGFIGEVHLRALAFNRRADVRAIAEVDAERGRDVQRRFNVPNVYTDVREMLEKEQLDGVVVATPDQLHREPVELAAQAGVHVLLEKPIATTVEDAEAIIDVTRKAGVKLMLAFVLRFTLPYQQLRAKIEAGEVGTPTMAYGKRAVSSPEAHRLAGRCTVNDYLSIHDTDTILWNMGTDVESVYAQRGSFVLKEQGLDTPDFYWTMLRFKSGATAVTHSHWAMPVAFPNAPESELLITGTKGAVHLRLAGQHLVFANDSGFEAPDVSYGFAAPDAGSFRKEDEHFTDCIIEDREPLVGGIDGLNALKVILAADESIRTGQPVKVELQDPRPAVATA
jgi:predicted dehydrogenase